MKKAISYWVAVQLLIVSFISFGQTANYNFGQYRLTKSKFLKETPLLVKASVGTFSFHSKVGGISFEQVATPEDSIANSTISLHYNASKPDGQRLQVYISGRTKPVQAAIYDWQIPVIAKYADSQYNAVYTLIGRTFGGNTSTIKYHPAFENTLLGLRMFQADLLFADSAGDFLSTMPTDTLGNLLLAESEIDVYTERSRYDFRYDSLISELGINNIYYNSYILTDWGREVKFGVADDNLFITGEPYYLFTNTISDNSGKALQSINALAKLREDIAKIRNSLAFKDLSKVLSLSDSSVKAQTLIVSKLKSLTSDNFVLKSWLSRLVDEMTYDFSLFDLKQLKTDLDSELPFANDELYLSILKLSSKQVITSWQQQNFSSWVSQLMYLYDEPYFSWLSTAYDNLDYWSTSRKVDLLTCESRRVETGNELIYNFNPVVNDACILTMRYAAFFRYVKITSPNAWKVFLQEISAVKMIPYPSDASAVVNKGIITPNEKEKRTN
jgi:hypothetical protein